MGDTVRSDDSDWREGGNLMGEIQPADGKYNQWSEMSGIFVS